MVRPTTRQASRDPVTPRLALLGGGGPFTEVVLQRLVEARLPPVVLVIPGGEAASGSLPVCRPGTLEAAALDAGVPVLGARRLTPDRVEALLAYGPQVLAGACTPTIVPTALLRRPTLACINLHPSLLPAYRGPDPLFWQFRAGEASGGVTLHRMTSAVDAGPVLGRVPLRIPAGITAGELDRRLALAGAALLADHLRDPDGAARPGDPQDETGASHQGPPPETAFALDPAWSAERAYRFVRGVREWGRSFPIAGVSGAPTVGDALGFSTDGCLGAPWVVRDGEIRVQFNPGILRGRLEEAASGSPSRT